MHRWGGLDRLRAQRCHVSNQQNYYKKGFFRMYVRIKSQPTISQVYNKLKTGNTLRKTIKMIIIFFIVILWFQMLWLNEYFLSIIFYRLDLQGKNILRGTEGNCFPFQTSSFVSVLPLVLLFKTQTFCITDRYLLNRRKFLQKL